MGRTVTVKGYFSPRGLKPQPCDVSLSLDGYGLHESLTAGCSGAYRVSIPFRPVERLAAELRRLVKGGEGTQEPSVTLEGTDSHLRSGKATVWLRGNGSFEMFTVELGGNGQISVPYAAVEQLVKRERSSQA